MGVDEHITTIRDVIEQLNGGDIDGVARHVSNGFTRHDLSGNFLADAVGSGEVKDFLHALYEAIPDLRIEIADIFGSEAKIAVRYDFKGTHVGTLLGVAGSGVALEFSGINIYRFEDGKIAEAWQLWDWATVLQQMHALMKGA